MIDEQPSTIDEFSLFLDLLNRRTDREKKLVRSIEKKLSFLLDHESAIETSVVNQFKKSTREPFNKRSIEQLKEELNRFFKDYDDLYMYEKKELDLMQPEANYGKLSQQSSQSIQQKIQLIQHSFISSDFTSTRAYKKLQLDEDQLRKQFEKLKGIMKADYVVDQIFIKLQDLIRVEQDLIRQEKQLVSDMIQWAGERELSRVDTYLNELNSIHKKLVSIVLEQKKEVSLPLEQLFSQENKLKHKAAKYQQKVGTNKLLTVLRGFFASYSKPITLDDVKRDFSALTVDEKKQYLRYLEPLSPFFAKGVDSYLRKQYQSITSLQNQTIQSLSTQQQSSLIDPLTGAYNRKFFDRELYSVVEMSIRNDHKCSVVFFDIDHFKQVNDTYGHQIGDITLRQFAATIMSSLRSTDRFCRYGGEEFVAILPDTDKNGAMSIVERIRKTVETLPIQKGDGSTFHITTSCGIATFPEDPHWVEIIKSHTGRAIAKDISHISKELLALADKRVYKAKKSGRNRVIAN